MYPGGTPVLLEMKKKQVAPPVFPGGKNAGLDLTPWHYVGKLEN